MPQTHLEMEQLRRLLRHSNASPSYLPAALAQKGGWIKCDSTNLFLLQTDKNTQSHHAERSLKI